MSEFSESYHLRTERSEDAVELLRRARLKGYVFPAIGGWVTFLAENGSFKPDQLIVANCPPAPLLHYVSAEDHGWGFTLFDQGNTACKYSCAWDPGLTIDDAHYSRDELQRLVPLADSLLLEEFESEMRPTEYKDIVGSEASKNFARALGLEHYEWIAYHYVDRDFRFGKNGRPNVIVVS